MKQISVKFGPVGYDCEVYGENGERFESVRRVEILSDADEITTARVTFMFPKIMPSEPTQAVRSVGVLGERYEIAVNPCEQTERRQPLGGGHLAQHGITDPAQSAG